MFRRGVLALLLLGACGKGAPEAQKDQGAVKGFDPRTRIALEKTLDMQFENSGVPGIAATVIVEGRGKWSAAWGMADVRTKRKVKRRHRLPREASPS
jgi:hypothetical protein